MPLPATSLFPTRRQALLCTAAALGSVLVPYAGSAEAFLMGTGIDGRPVHALDAGNAPSGAAIRYTVTVFVATDCPVSNRYLPLLARLSRQYAARGVRFWLVYPNSSDTLALVQQHQQQYPDAAALYQLIDPNRAFLAGAHVHVTPEAAIFPSSGTMPQPPLWHGRIDNRYLTFGTQRPAATEHDLANAIDAVLAGRRPAPPAAPPVGCAILPRA